MSVLQIPLGQFALPTGEGHRLRLWLCLLPCKLNDFGETQRDLEKGFGWLSKIYHFFHKKFVFYWRVFRSLESYFFMKNSAFHCRLSVSCFFSFFLSLQFEKEFTDHQETQAQLQKKEAKINELQAELQAFKSQVKYHLPGLNLAIESLLWKQRSCHIFIV